MAVTQFASPLDFSRTLLALPHSVGSGVFVLPQGYGAVINQGLANVGLPSISVSNPIRFVVINANYYNAQLNLLLDPTKVAIYEATGLTGDTLSGSSTVEGTVDQIFGGGDIWAVQLTAGQTVAIQNAVNALEQSSAATVGASYVLQTPNSFLPGAQSLSVLGGGIMYAVQTTGVVRIATAGVNFVLPTGVAGGQVIFGGVNASDTLTLTGSSNATNGNIFIQSTNQFFDGNGNYSFTHALDSLANPQSIVQSAPIVQFNHTDTGTDLAMTTLWTAFQFTATCTSPRGLGLRLKKSSGTLANPADKITFRVYSDNAGQPGANMSGSDQPISFRPLTTAYIEFAPAVGGGITLVPGTKYWIVVFFGALPSGVTVSIDTGAVADTLVATGANGTVWSVASGAACYFDMYGQNGQILFTSQTATTVNATSSTQQAVFATSTYNTAVQGTSTYGTAVRGTSTDGDGGNFATTNGIGANAFSAFNVAVMATQNGNLAQNTTNSTFYAKRQHTLGGFTSTGAIGRFEDTTNSTGNLSEWVKVGVTQSSLSSAGIWTALKPVQFQINDTGGQVWCAGAAYGVVSGVKTSTGTIAQNSSTMTVPGATFTAADAGKWILVPGSGAAGADLSTTITTPIAGTTITLSSPALTAVTSAPLTYGFDNSAALNALFITAGVGATILIPPGSYAAHNISPLSGQRIIGYGASLYLSTSFSTSFLINLNGATTATTTALTGNVVVCANTISVTSAAGFAIGDYCLLFDLTYKVASTTSGRNQEIVRIINIVGTTITVADQVYGSYATASTATLTKLAAITDVTIEGLTLINPSPTVGSGGLNIATYAYRCTWLNVAAVHPSAPAWNIGQSQYIDILHCSSRDGLGVSIAGTGYGIDYTDSSLYGNVVSFSCEAIRENLCTNNSRGISWIDCLAISPRDTGFNTHGQGSENIDFINCRVFNSIAQGFAVGFLTDSAPDINISFIGCRAYNSGTSSLAIKANTVGGYFHGPILVDGCEWAGWGLNGGPVSYGCALQYADGLTYTNNLHWNPTGSAVTAVLLTNSQNSRLADNVFRSLNGADGIDYSVLTNVVIENNNLFTNNCAPLHSSGSNTNVTVQGNKAIGTTIANIWSNTEANYNNFVNGVIDANIPIKTKAGPLTDADFNSPVDGLYGVNTNTGQLMIREGGQWFSIERTLWLQTSSVTLANSSVETSLTAGATAGGATQSLTLPANFFQTVGQTLEIEASGVLSFTSVAPTLTLQFKVNSTAGTITIIGDGGPTAPTTSKTNKAWFFHALITCRSVGTTGTVFSQGHEGICNATSSLVLNGAPTTAVVTLNTTLAQSMDFTAKFNNADPNNSITMTDFKIIAKGN